MCKKYTGFYPSFSTDRPVYFSFLSALNSDIQLWDTVMSGLRTGRNLRTSTIYTRMEHDATFGQSMGYERPLYFNSSLANQGILITKVNYMGKLQYL